MTRRTYTPEQREEALTVAEKHGRRVAAQRTGIPAGTIAKWHRHARRGGRPGLASGRPSLVSDAVRDRLIESLRLGDTLVGASRHAGIHINTLKEWRDRGHAELARRRALPDPDDPHADPRPELRRTEEPYVTVTLATETARADARARHLRIIQQAAEGGIPIERRRVTYPDGRIEEFEKLTRPEWQAAAWLTERVYPDEFGRRTRHEHVGDGGGPIRVDTSEQRRDEVARMRDELAARRQRLAAVPDTGT